MKHIISLALFILATATFSSVFAQENTTSIDESTSTLSKFSVSPTIGFLNSWGDLSTAGRFAELADPAQNKLGYGLRVNYDFLPFLRVSGGVIAGKLTDFHNEINTTGAVNEPRDLGLGILYETNTFEVILPRLDVNLTRLIFQNRSKFFNSFSASLHAGHGLLFFDSKIYATEDPETHLLYGKHRGRSGKTKETVTSVGLNFAYRVSDQFDINLGTSYRNVWNDRLDAWESPGSSNDKITYTSLGLTFYFDKRKKPTVSDRIKDKKSRTEAAEEKSEQEPTTEEESVTEDDSKSKPKYDSSYAVLKNPVVEEEPKKDTSTVTEAVPEKVEVSEEPKDAAETSTPEKVSEKPVTAENGPGNYVIVSAFKTQKVAEVSAEKFKEKGESPTVVHDEKRGYYLVSIDRFDDLDVALQRMRQARSKGYKLSWVYIKTD